MESSDVIIVGGGVGGLVAGALAAESGARVILLEQADNLGGCAATFFRRGYLFDAGATIGSGFHPDGPMHWLAGRLDIRWPTCPLPVAWEYCDGDLTVSLDRNGENVLQRFPQSESFWREQTEVAGCLWRWLASLLALYGQNRFQQAKGAAATLSSEIMSIGILRLATMTVGQWLRRHGLAANKAFCRFIDAQLLISAQTTSAHCNALFAAMALDLPKRSPCTLDGGMGRIAEILSQVIAAKGGHVMLGERVTSLVVTGSKISEVVTTRDRYQGKEVIVNGSSALLDHLLSADVPESWPEQARAAWGAFILHLGVDQGVMTGRPCDHLQLLHPDSNGLAEGRSLFLSASPSADESRAPVGKRAVSLSTHTAVASWWRAWQQGPRAYGDLKMEYTRRVLDLAEQYVPGLGRGIGLCLAGTPVTYARYTGRHLGLVGGYAQTRVWPPRQELHGLKNCTLVGDHCFPGQSIAGVTVGAALAVDRLMRRLSSQRRRG